MPTVKGARPRTSSDARGRLLAATSGLLATAGFSGATTRAIGEAAGCNPALISYHFGSLNELLLAAWTPPASSACSATAASWRRQTIKEIRAAVRRLYREDRETGHVTVLAEMVAGGLMDRELGPAVAARVQPWIDLAEDAVGRVLPSPVRRRAPTRHIAYAVVATFLGLEILGQLAGDHGRDEAVVDRLTSGSFWQT
jgi:AcrR family transcriptional regulator